jgi:NitT/TauT family transport system substrate-binding protein
MKQQTPLSRRCSALLRIAAHLALGAAAALAALPSTAQEKITMRVDFTPSGSQSAFHLAVVKGWFKEAGLDVDVQDGRGSINGIQLVGAGQIDFAWVSLGPMAIAREQGLPVTSVAGVFRRGDLAVIVDEKSNIRVPADLAGKRIVCFTASPWFPFIDPFLKTAGLSRSDVNLAFIDPTSLFANYASGQSDAVMTLGPFALPVINVTRKSRQIVASDYGIAFPSFGIVTREETIAKRAPTVERFVKTALRAWAYILDGHEGEAADAVMALRPGIKLNRDVLIGQANSYKEFIDTPNTRGKPLGWQSELDWQAAMATMQTAGVLKAGHKPEEFFTNRFVN